MADSTDVQYLGPLASLLISLISGLVIHSFIIGVNVNDWWKGRSVTAVDHVITSVCISRIFAQCSFVLYLFVDTFFMKKMFVDGTLLLVGVLSTFFIYVNVWLTTLLSIVFSLKISNLQTRLFLYLRRMILQRTVHFIVASVLLSALSSLIIVSVSLNETVKGEAYNVTMDNEFAGYIFNNFIYIHIIGTFFPLLFCCTSSVLLLTPLYRHTTRMKRSGNLTINLETYYSVMRFVSLTFIYNTTYFIVHFAAAIYYCLYWTGLPWLYIFLGFLPPLHSSFLIYGTAKLRSRMSMFLENVIDFLFQRNRESRENIKVVDQ